MEPPKITFNKIKINNSGLSRHSTKTILVDLMMRKDLLHCFIAVAGKDPLKNIFMLFLGVPSHDCDVAITWHFTKHFCGFIIIIIILVTCKLHYPTRTFPLTVFHTKILPETMVNEEIIFPSFFIYLSFPSHFLQIINPAKKKHTKWMHSQGFFLVSI